MGNREIQHVLELNFTRGWRGGERQTLYNAMGFRDLGMKVSFLCRRNSVLELKAKEAGFKVYAFESVFGVLRFLFFQARRFNVLHAQTAQILTYCILAKPFLQAKIVFTRRIEFVPNGWLTRLKYRSADLLVGISLPVKHIVEKFASKPVHLISDIVISRPLDSMKADLLKAELNIPDGTKILATLAALEKYKDPLTLIHAISQLAQYRTDFVFLHFGNGEMYEELVILINQLEIGKYYRLMGFHQDPEDYYSLFDVFVMCTTHEGLGSSVLDAFLYKVPVVSTNVGGLSNLLADGRGILCGIKDPNSLCKGIIKILSEPDLIPGMLNRAQRYVKHYHSLEFISEQYAQLFKS